MSDFDTDTAFTHIKELRSVAARFDNLFEIEKINQVFRNDTLPYMENAAVYFVALIKNHSNAIAAVARLEREKTALINQHDSLLAAIAELDANNKHLSKRNERMETKIKNAARVVRDAAR